MINKEEIVKAFRGGDLNTLSSFVKYNKKEVLNCLNDTQIILEGFKLKRFFLINYLKALNVIDVQTIKSALSGGNKDFGPLELYVIGSNMEHVLFSSLYVSPGALCVKFQSNLEKIFVENSQSFTLILTNFSCIYSIMNNTHNLFASAKDLGVLTHSKDIFQAILFQLAPELQNLTGISPQTLIYCMQPKNYLGHKSVCGMGKLLSLLLVKVEEERVRQ
jgi:hypothetical protein